jgi:hypothetical protein
MIRFNTLLLLLVITLFSCDKSETSLKPNAVIIDFNPHKCYCCWGWTIKMGSDTIKSDNIIIGETIGYQIDYPVDVYIEIGELETKCIDLGLMMDTSKDYYEVIKIEKIN